MKYKEIKEYQHQAQNILLKGSFSNAMDLKMKLVEAFNKEGKCEMAKLINDISFLPHYQTTSNDPISQERRAQAMCNGVQNIINIINQDIATRKEKIDNCRFWISLGIAIVSIILAVIGLL